MEKLFESLVFLKKSSNFIYQRSSEIFQIENRRFLSVLESKQVDDNENLSVISYFNNYSE